MIPKYIDIHCHIFNKDILFNPITIMRILYSLPHILFEEKATSDQKMLALEMEKANSELANILNFLTTAFDNTEEELFLQMNADYNDNFAVAPLMFDLDGCFESNLPCWKRLFSYTEADLFRSIDDHIELIFKLIGQTRGKLEFKQYSFLISRLESLEKMLVKYVEEAKKVKNQKVTDGFEDQITQLTNLKTKYPDKIYPFFAIDPRRKGIIKRFQQEIYPTNVFQGVKLYTPNGYSPTDPALYGDGGLYAFCVQHDIPIIAHNSATGFASPLNKIKITGDIYLDGKLKGVNGAVKFVPLLKGDFISDKAHKLNYPILWKKVLDRYPTLRLNLAHLGTGESEWQHIILDMLCQRSSGKLTYPHLYTDLSSFTSKKQLANAKQCYDAADPEVKKKFLYGSDFILNLLKIEDLQLYLSQFKETFCDNDQFDQIAGENPKTFLKIKNHYQP